MQHSDKYRESVIARGALLSRDQFRESVITRDGKCVICGLTDTRLDAHHIIERRLWDDGGYYLDNGASLCGECHLDAESTAISCDEIRTAAGIRTVLIPDHFDHENRYDKWGNIINPNGTRIPGELFYDESVQKILGEARGLFVPYIKYPRTFHLPWSPGATDDDHVMNDTSCFDGKEVVITEKMDGENTTMYHDHIHARSIDSGSHLSRSWVRSLHSGIAHEIPVGWRICGENLYAKHSLFYDSLPSYFVVFSIWNDRNVCLSWDDTVTYAAVLNLAVVPILYRGIWSEQQCRTIQGQLNIDKQEGYVVRVTEQFGYGLFRRSVGKWVRRDHVETDDHWLFRSITPNKLYDCQRSSRMVR